MFMAQNTSKGVRTRQVDTQYHFIREGVEEGTFKLNLLVHLITIPIFYEECESGDVQATGEEVLS
jgi:hypothetical protein